MAQKKTYGLLSQIPFHSQFAQNAGKNSKFPSVHRKIKINLEDRPILVKFLILDRTVELFDFFLHRHVAQTAGTRKGFCRAGLLDRPKEGLQIFSFKIMPHLEDIFHFLLS